MADRGERLGPVLDHRGDARLHVVVRADQPAELAGPLLFQHDRVPLPDLGHGIRETAQRARDIERRAIIATITRASIGRPAITI